MRSRRPLALSFFALTALAPAQAPPANGPAETDLGHWALVGGDVVVRPGERIANATLVLDKGLVVSVAPGAAAPPGARVFDCQGLTLYPGLIEPFLPVDAPAPDVDGPAAHWHPMVLPQRSALDGDGATADDRRQLRELGFLAAAIAPTGGVFKGSAAVVLLGEPATGEKAAVVRDRCYQLCSLQPRSSGHPDSEMGAISLLRQTLLDADWFERCRAAVAADASLRATMPPATAALSALADQRALPLAFDLEDELEVMRVAKVVAEFQRPAFAIGSGMEFRRLQAVAATKLPLVVPLHFPDAPDVATAAKAERVSLRQLQSWEQAPTDLKRLLDAGVRVALTTARLPQKQDFRERLAQALACGVTPDQALAALTTTPAELLLVADRLGTLQPGRIANVLAVAGDLFDPKAKLRQAWVAGRRHELAPAPAPGFDGRWQVTFALPTAVAAELVIRDGQVSAKFGEREQKARGVQLDGERLEFQLADPALGEAGPFWCRAVLAQGRLSGGVRTGHGDRFALAAERTGDAPPAKDKADRGDKSDKSGKTDAALPPPGIEPLPLPLGGFGATAPPAAQAALFTNATLWTCADAGVVAAGVLYVKDGRIVYVGPSNGLPRLPDGTTVVDCTGKHITPGLIDCHSHTGISRGVNEGGEAVTAEVRVQDVINPDDVNWYRELAGGVTTVNQLHGSANAIGGQSCTTKIRWGCVAADEMVLQGHAPGIKFALGENPRRANGDRQGDRYPNTRMGVEALIRDRFLAAADYRRRIADYEGLLPKQRAKVLPPRRDLELEALAEVLAGQRRIHCHSYRQDEIFMLCGLAKEFGFRIGTFQHVLEGYKVADAIAAAAVGASSFSDWWAYKFEVYDAIPENGAIMRDAGVCVSFNSDSDELARRLNTEAGKAVKYGGVPPAEALKFVTLNPAIQLGIEARTGSLERGKDADFAVWSAEPLSYAAICEQTWVDGTLRFSRAHDQELRDLAAVDRQRLLQKALAAGKDKKGAGRAEERDAYWAAEDLTASYCCRDCAGDRR